MNSLVKTVLLLRIFFILNVNSLTDATEFPTQEALTSHSSNEPNPTKSNRTLISKAEEVPAKPDEGPILNKIDGYWGIVAEALNLVNPPGANKTKSANLVEVTPGFHPLKTLLVPGSPSNQTVSSEESEGSASAGRQFKSNSATPKNAHKSSKVLKSWPALESKKKRKKKSRKSKTARPRSYRRPRGGAGGAGPFKPSFIPLRPQKNDTHSSYVYYTAEPNLSNSLTEHHLAIVEVPKGARGVIPLKNVHIIAPGPSRETSGSSTFYPSAKVTPGATPYVVAQKAQGRSGVDQPFLVLPLSSRHGRRHGVNNVILPLQKSPPAIERLSDSFNDFRVVQDKVNEEWEDQSEVEDVFGPPKTDDIVENEGEEQLNSPEVIYHTPQITASKPSFGPSSANSKAPVYNQPQSESSSIKGMKPPSITGQFLSHNIVKTTEKPTKNKAVKTTRKRWPNVGNSRLPKWFKSRPTALPSPIYRTPNIRLAYTRHQRRHPDEVTATHPQKENPFVDILLRSRDQITKGIRYFPRWVDEMIGADSLSHREYARPNALPAFVHPSQPWKTRGKTNRGRDALGGTIRHAHPNENSIFFKKLPSFVPNTVNRGTTVKRLKPLSTTTNVNLSAKTPRAIIREDAQYPPRNFLYLSTRENTRPAHLPSHHSSLAVDFTDPRGGRYTVASPSNTKILLTNDYRGLENSQTNPPRVKSLNGQEKYTGPPLVMFTLEDAIPLVPSKQIVPAISKPSQDSLFSSTGVSDQTFMQTPYTKEKRKKYYMVKVRGQPSPKKIKDLLTSGGNGNIRITPNDKNLPRGNEAFTPAYDSTSETKAPLAFFNKLPTTTKPAQTPPIYQATSENLATSKLAGGTLSNGKLKTTFFNSNQPTEDKKQNINNYSEESNYKISDSFKPGINWKTTNAPSDPEPNWTSKRQTISEPNQRSQTTIQQEKSPHDASHELSTSSPTTLQVPQENETGSIDDTTEVPHVTGKPQWFNFKPKPRRTNSTSSGLFTKTKDASETAVQNGFKWFQGFKKKPGGNDQREDESRKSPFGFRFGGLNAKTRSTARPSTSKIKPSDFSHMFFKNWEEKTSGDMQMSASEEDVVRVPFEDKEPIGSYSEPDEFVFKWPKYVRPPLKKDYTQLETIKSSVSDIIKQNSFDAIAEMNEKTAPKTEEETSLCDDENEAADLPQPAKLVQGKSSPQHTKAAVSPFQKFRTRQTSREAKVRPREPQEATTAPPYETVSRTISTATPLFTTPPTSSTTFRISAKGAAPPKRPLTLLSLLRKRKRNREKDAAKNFTFPTETTTAASWPNQTTTTTKPKYFARNHKRRRRLNRFSLNRLKTGAPTPAPETTTTTTTTNHRQMADESELIEQQRKPIESVFLQDSHLPFFGKNRTQTPTPTKRPNFFSETTTERNPPKFSFSWGQTGKTSSEALQRAPFFAAAPPHPPRPPPVDVAQSHSYTNVQVAQSD